VVPLSQLGATPTSLDQKPHPRKCRKNHQPTRQNPRPPSTRESASSSPEFHRPQAPNFSSPHPLECKVANTTPPRQLAPGQSLARRHQHTTTPKPPPPNRRSLRHENKSAPATTESVGPSGMAARPGYRAPGSGRSPSRS